MPGVYVHIPFCRAKCAYCNFYSTAAKEKIAPYLDALLAELSLRNNYLGSRKIDTLYFGGGTPSIIGISAIDRLIGEISAVFSLCTDAEITVEANPDDLTADFARKLRSAGINRLSIGVQSFRDADLRYLGRAHNGEKALRALDSAFESGFDNITADLIFGIPSLDDDGLLKNIDRCVELGVPHISAYGLTVEPDTALERMINLGTRQPIDEEQSARQYELLMGKMRSYDYIHYEISNFCREGFIARHNSAYWKGEHYLGIGASAHSYNGTSRQWNIADVDDYTTAINGRERFFDSEELSTTRRYNEYVMTSLRTIWGTSADHIARSFGVRYAAYFRDNAESSVRSGDLRTDGDLLRLSERGKLIADKIISDLFIVEDHFEKE
jgi:oxygen-independent coproporphyrinogen III oxidase